MYLNEFHTEENQAFQFTRQQASEFAKTIAGDFNPIHDVDNKRFCVPGDLLFALMLHKNGLSQKMSFNFAGMVNENTQVKIVENKDGLAILAGDANKVYLEMDHSGSVSSDQQLIERVVKSYVAFSGMNFPHIMVPLMREQGKMINIARPLVMYQRMEVEFEHLDISDPKVNFTGAKMDVNGKRANVTLNFDFVENGKVIGHGVKNMVMSGLVDFDETGLQMLVDKFNQLKTRYKQVA
jgi:hypothetical protein